MLHTIVSAPYSPDKLWVGISAAGVFATEDGGETWDRRNRLSNSGAHTSHNHPAAPHDGEVGHCVHNMVRAPGPNDLLYQQNHHGVWRSTDGGRSWNDITAGLPSTFGFPIWVHPRDPNTIWTLPLNGDSAGRYPPEAAAAVWRSRDGGQSWQAMRNGLPQTSCFFTVLRQAMGGDARDPAGLYLWYKQWLGVRERRRRRQLARGRPSFADDTFRRGTRPKLAWSPRMRNRSQISPADLRHLRKPRTSTDDVRRRRGCLRGSGLRSRTARGGLAYVRRQEPR